MSFQVPPPPALASTPTANDDVTRGFYVGMTVVDQSASPPVLYVCAANTPGAARWSVVGVLLRLNDVSLGAFTTLNLTNATATVYNGVATVSPKGGWRNYYAETASEGQTFFPLVGVSVAPQDHQVFANGMLLRLGAQYDYTVSATGITLNFLMGGGQPLVVYY